MKDTTFIQSEFIAELQKTASRLNLLLCKIGVGEPLDRYLTITEAAKLLSKSRGTVYKLIKQGTLKAYRINSSRMCLKLAEVSQAYQHVQFKYQSVKQVKISNHDN